jgi:hypothetical protein
VQHAPGLGGRCLFGVDSPFDYVLPLAVLADMVDSYPAVGRDGNPSGGQVMGSVRVFGLAVPLLAAVLVPSAQPSAGYGHRRWFLVPSEVAGS